MTSTKAAGQLCKHKAIGSRGARAGRCHLHDLGPGPSPGRGQTALAGSPRVPVGCRNTAQTPLPAPRRAHILLGDPGTSHRDVSCSHTVLPAGLALGTPGGALSRCCRPRPQHRRHIRSCPACLSQGCEVVLALGSVFRAKERGMHQPEPKPWPCKSPLSWEEPAISWLPGGSRELQKIPSACLDCIKGIYFVCPLAITFIVRLCFIAAQVYLQN